MIHPVKGKFLYDRVQGPEPPSPLMGEGWDEGDEGSSSTPTPTLTHHRRGGILSRVKSNHALDPSPSRRG
jgi:hypothetical protein